MRVTIEHREQAGGALGNRQDCYVDCRVEFSEEERAIIKARDLYREGFTVRASTPAPTEAQFFSTAVIRTIGRIMIVGGLFYGMIVEGIGGAKSNIGGPVLLIGIVLEIYGWLRTRREDKRVEDHEQTITVQQLLTSPTFTVHAWNAGTAKGVEEEIHEGLVKLKTLIVNSAQLQPRRSYEL